MNKVQDFNVNANGFTVLDAHDGIYGGNRLWFGICSECNETVTNSHLIGVWEHRLPLSENSWRSVDYCPSKQ